MSQDSTLANALVDVRRKQTALEADYEQIGAELTKLRPTERALAGIVEGTPLDEPCAERPGHRAAGGDDRARSRRGTGRGPRANSAKGRFKTLLEEAGPQGLSHAQISDRLLDVVPNTLATDLNMLPTSGEVERHDDFYRGITPAAEPGDDASEGRDHHGVEHDPAVEA